MSDSVLTTTIAGNIIELNKTKSINGIIASSLECMRGSFDVGGLNGISNENGRKQISDENDLTILLWYDNEELQDGMFNGIPSCINSSDGEFNYRLVCYFNTNNNIDENFVKGKMLRKDNTQCFKLTDNTVKVGLKWKINAGEIADRQFNCIALLKNNFKNKTGSCLYGGKESRKLPYIKGSKSGYETGYKNYYNVNQCIVPYGITGITDNSIIIANRIDYKDSLYTFNILRYNVDLLTVSKLSNDLTDYKLLADARLGIIYVNEGSGSYPTHCYYISVQTTNVYLVKVNLANASIQSLDITSIYIGFGFGLKSNFFMFNNNIYVGTHMIENMSTITENSYLSSNNVIIRASDYNHYIKYTETDDGYGVYKSTNDNPMDDNSIYTFADGFEYGTPFGPNFVVLSDFKYSNNVYCAGVGISNIPTIDDVDKYNSNILAYKKLETAITIKSTREYVMNMSASINIVN